MHLSLTTAAGRTPRPDFPIANSVVDLNPIVVPPVMPSIWHASLLAKFAIQRPNHRLQLRKPSTHPEHVFHSALAN